MAKRELIGIGMMKVSAEPGEQLVAPNLGSCLGLAAYDPVAKIGGMIHCLLPLSTSDPAKAQANPCTYVDTGVVQLLNALLALGATKSRLVLTVAGGANINDPNNVFAIGSKNYTVLRKVLWKNNLLIKGEHVGEGSSRTISLDIDSGRVWVKTEGQEIQLA